MMDQKKLLKQMIDFNKATFDNSFNALVLFQDQLEKVAGTLLDQATWLPEEGRSAIREWVDSYKKGRETFKSTVDESFKRVESFFGES